ncbi:MAG: hypothetical protein A2527_05810 [Candidatus Lambdaproteobacteria bacterium RIFOXYD2_FULL_50_16]|uniref:tRNA/rRNA methyltransferase SpoU type domain-containing protein n=1 Tax=Candidatus Lambdaproteobacteria bacterium RIFOXYD2_FULL_50_16 TaxID=1817772 RepID=A0A1F6G9B6_9PROT|nr:MAG: hypothetical protein A2527_05810 [Candidatus Lambdaproteobacteria bacterium RIFOXYD2_FULL_50_16]
MVNEPANLSVFNMTQARLFSLPPARRHKWLARGLAGLYQALLETDLTQTSLEFTWAKYQKACGWLGLEVEANPPLSKGAWFEWLADHFHRHQALTGLGLPEDQLLHPVIQGDRLEAGPWQPRYPVWVALEKIRSAFNLGSILRSIDALGFAGVILGPQSPPPAHNQVRKAAMGTAGWIPALQPADFWGHLSRMETEGFRLIGLERTQNSLSYRRYPWPRKLVLLLGNEEYGLSQQALVRSQVLVHLPMAGRKNSLNLANAFCAVGFELAHQFEVRDA